MDALGFFLGFLTERRHCVCRPLKSFRGTGAYALYYTGKSEMYKALFKVNRVEFRFPICVGKAVPSRWRQARNDLASAELYRRLREHAKSVEDVDNLDIVDFYCREPSAF
jgi:hypothetical protein